MWPSFFSSSFNIEEIKMDITTVKLLTSQQNLWNRRKMVYIWRNSKSLFQLRLNKNSSHFKQTKKIKENKKSVKYIKGEDRRMLSWINSCNRFALLKFCSLYWNFFLNVPFFSLSKSTFRPLIELDEGQNRAALRKDHFFSNEKRLQVKLHSDAQNI